MNRIRAKIRWIEFALGIAVLLGAPLTAWAEDLTFDFRAGHFNEQLFRFVGDRAADLVRPDAGGLRWRFQAGNAPKQPVGIHWRSNVAGDFVATAHYEILPNERPDGAALAAPMKGGVGFEVYLMLDNAAKDGVALARLVYPGAGPVISFNYMTNNEEGKRYSKTQKTIALAPESQRGRLRLAREGTVLIASWAEGDNGDFAELLRTEVGREDVRMVRMAGITSGDTNAQFDLRLLEAQLNANVPALAGKGLPAAKNPIAANSRVWTWGRRRGFEPRLLLRCPPRAHDRDLQRLLPQFLCQ